ncbi:MAG: pyridoxamine 5'-phosphate oxidase family protein [Anaerolineales bacterium]|nr:pyridoxamine 5'-phosphate oxidase family protein [Anaerolineales bacterium]
MSSQPPERLAILLERETKAFAQLALVRKDGTPHVSPIWFDYVDGLIILNTARGRVKDKALARHPVVALSIVDPKDPYRYLLVKGPVVAETEVGGFDQICDLNVKYRGNPNYPQVAGQVRVTYKIRPDSWYPEK